jgi:hypothetical protein
MLTLLGLHDDYGHDGRTVVDPLYDWAVPQSLIAHRQAVLQLGAVYKQLNASFGEFAMASLRASTNALASDTPGDARYTSIENSIADLTAQRDALAEQIKAQLNAAAFDGQPLNEQQAKKEIAQANALIAQAQALAAS